MVSCPRSSIPQISDHPQRCYIDVINIGYFNVTHPVVKSDVDMPWLDLVRFLILVRATYLPQRILFDLPFLYYVKLVIVLFSDHYSLLL